jgi:drug/metabolite transporter (DMT)-like permease
LGDFGNSAAFVFPIYNVLSMLTSALMAWVLFKETLEPLNKLGLALAVVAICLISYQEIFSVF